MILELATLLFFAFIFFLVVVVIVVYLATSVPASLTYSMEWSAGWWQLSITWIDPAPSSPTEQVERPDSPHPYNSPNVFPDWHAPETQGWTLHPGDFFTPVPNPPPPPPYVPTTIMTQERVIEDREPGSDWDYCPTWGALADFPFQEEDLPF
ncbi:hypothetical protein OG21DRAFT_1491024 [Imleria badia]|nr:hypothetical protein OG21DRAFT_1491024 [Imleria badia]